jgi:hypothetical protein
MKSGGLLWALGSGLHCVFLLVLMGAHHSIGDLTPGFAFMYMSVAAVQIALLLVWNKDYRASRND